MNDLEAVQKFFVQELQFGEELLAMGKQLSHRRGMPADARLQGRSKVASST